MRCVSGVSVLGYMFMEFLTSNSFSFFYITINIDTPGLIHCSKATIHIRKLSHCCTTVSHEAV